MFGQLKNRKFQLDFKICVFFFAFAASKKLTYFEAALVFHWPYIRASQNNYHHHRQVNPYFDAVSQTKNPCCLCCLLICIRCTTTTKFTARKDSNDKLFASNNRKKLLINWLLVSRSKNHELYCV